MLCFHRGVFLLVVRVCFVLPFCLSFLSFKGNQRKKIIILVASNCRVRYEIKLEAMIQLFGTGIETETLLILAAAQLHLCDALWSHRLHADLAACIFGT